MVWMWQYLIIQYCWQGFELPGDLNALILDYSMLLARIWIAWRFECTIIWLFDVAGKNLNCLEIWMRQYWIIQCCWQEFELPGDLNASILDYSMLLARIWIAWRFEYVNIGLFNVAGKNLNCPEIWMRQYWIIQCCWQGFELPGDLNTSILDYSMLLELPEDLNVTIFDHSILLARIWIAWRFERIKY